MLAIFSRTDNPKTQGAHGYSTLIVSVVNYDNLKILDGLLCGCQIKLKEPWKHPYHWYSGTFDLVSLIEGEIISMTPNKMSVEQCLNSYYPGKMSIGDNRFIGYYTSDEIIEQYYKCPKYLKES